MMEDMNKKEKIWEELLEFLEGQEAMKIKPQAKVEMLSVEKEPEEMEEGGSNMPKSMDSDGAMDNDMVDEDEMDEEKLKRLIMSRMG